MTKHNIPISERLSEKMIPLAECGCHIWMGSLGSGGYGQLKIRGKVVDAHRASFELAYGEIPEGLWILHTCDIRPCINADHLYAGTPADNTSDMLRRDRGRWRLHDVNSKILEAKSQ